MADKPNLRTLIAIPRDIMDALDQRRAAIAADTSEPCSRSALIRAILRAELLPREAGD